MSEFNNDDRDGSYRNNYNPNYGREIVYGYSQGPHRRGGRGGGPWLTATLVLVAFLAGALMVRYIPAFGPAAATAGPTARPTAPAALHTAEASLPPIGGKLTVPLEAGDIPAIARAVGPAVVGVVNKAGGFMWMDPGAGSGQEQEQGTGSGVIISADGYVVTNYHVIEGAESISVTLPGGKEVDAKLVGADAQTDLAVLKIEEAGLTAAPIGNSDIMEVGQAVIAIGNPLGKELAGTVTMGILSARDRELIVDGYKYNLFQTDAAINPGNSGGALVNMAGELIGINNLKSVSAGTDAYGNTISAEGIGFSIPINDAMPIIGQLIAEGYIPRPMLGIDVSVDVTAAMARRYDVPQGVYLRSIAPGGPLARANIRKGDIITEIDGTGVTSIANVNGVLAGYKIGDTVKVTFWRESRGFLVADVTLEGSSK